MMQDLPLEERPRERLQRLGAGSLSSVELIAIILGEGTRGKSALQLAAEVISRFRSLEGLYQATLEELTSIEGIGEAKAIRLKAALQLSSQLKQLPVKKKIYYSAVPDDIFSYIKEDFIGKEVEVLLMVYLDSRLRAFHKEVIGIGTLNSLLLDPKEVFYRAIKKRADQFILAHNHPSGDPSPSEEDIRISKILFQMSCLMECKMRDHLIVSGDRYISLRNCDLL